MEHPAACDRTQFVEAIASFVAHKGGLDTALVRGTVERGIEDLGSDSVARLQSRLAQTSDAWSYYPRDPLAHRVHHALAGLLLKEPPVVSGIAHLEEIRGQVVIIVANHLSYSDANVIELLLQQSGGTDVAERLSVVAGPKVYSDLSRRFSSLCFGTIKSPQNDGVSSGNAVMTTREVALAARQTIQSAEERLRAGDAVLLFPEGTRSRSRGMQQFLPGVSRYFTLPDLWVLPVGLTGTEQLFAIDQEQIGSARITMTIGRPMPVESIRAATGSERRTFVDALGRAVASLLPEQYRGVYK